MVSTPDSVATGVCMQTKLWLYFTLDLRSLTFNNIKIVLFNVYRFAMCFARTLSLYNREFHHSSSSVTILPHDTFCTCAHVYSEPVAYSGERL